MKRCVGMRGDAGRCGKVRGDAGRCGEMREIRGGSACRVAAQVFEDRIEVGRVGAVE